jgi:hypothetical protein
MTKQLQAMESRKLKSLNYPKDKKAEQNAKQVILEVRLSSLQEASQPRLYNKNLNILNTM